jgi:hypothetical protein
LAFRAGLIEIINFNKRKRNNAKITSVLCPGLGTLTGKISVINCARQMRYAYDSMVYHRYEFPNDLSTVRDCIIS